MRHQLRYTPGRRVSFGLIDRIPAMSAAVSESPLTAALITAPGRGAVATIRVKGSPEPLARVIDRYFAAANQRSFREQRAGRVCFGQWHSGAWNEPGRMAGQPGSARDDDEDIVLSRVDETSVEINCHGGAAAVNRILAALSQAGVQTVSWERQKASRAPLFDVECSAALARTTTATTAQILLRQASGLLKEHLEQLLQLAETPESVDSRERLTAGLSRLSRFAAFGRHLTEPWRVVIAGRPNAGKSTLLNALLGFTRAIVFDQPGTTRDVVTGETAFEGWPVILADTAGLRETDDRLEREGIARTRQAVQDADLILLLLDVSRPVDVDEQHLLDEFAESPHCLIVAGKCDLPCAWSRPLPEDCLRLSAVTALGLRELMGAIVRRLVPEVPANDWPVPVTARQGRCLHEAWQALQAGQVDLVQAALRECLQPSVEVLENGFRTESL